MAKSLEDYSAEGFEPPSELSPDELVNLCRTTSENIESFGPEQTAKAIRALAAQLIFTIAAKNELEAYIERHGFGLAGRED